MGFSFKKIAASAGAAFVAFLAGAGTVSAAVCDSEKIGLRGDWGQAQFSIEIADDFAERAQGLMNREQMARNAGMLFVYDAPQPVAFWMRNTLIPLDMLFIGPRGQVTAIHENAVPLDETAIPGGDNVQYVLELNGGTAALMGITIGSQVQHPAIDQNTALWGCEAQ